MKTQYPPTTRFTLIPYNIERILVRYLDETKPLPPEILQLKGRSAHLVFPYRSLKKIIIDDLLKMQHVKVTKLKRLPTQEWSVEGENLNEEFRMPLEEFAKKYRTEMTTELYRFLTFYPRANPIILADFLQMCHSEVGKLAKGFGKIRKQQFKELLVKKLAINPEVFELFKEE